MPKLTRKLTALSIANLKKPGLHGDGGGLFLQVTVGKDSVIRKSWVVRFRIPGPEGKVRNCRGEEVAKTFEMGLGSAAHVSLQIAREEAAKAKALAARCINPILHRDQERQKRADTAAKAKTFSEAVTSFLADHDASWKNQKHRDQWRNTLKTYAEPIIGQIDVAAITVDHILKIIQPIWHTKTETAGRVRSRIERILDWATVRRLRSGDNPARWRGYLEFTLPQQSELKPVKHHAAVPYVEMPAFMIKLRQSDGIGARALEFTILTAARTGETIGAKWREIDVDKRVWTIPAERMKAKRAHRVPLTNAALALLKPLRLGRGVDDYVFPGLDMKKPLSTATMSKTLSTIRDDCTVHGFRSTFRDWVSETTNFDRPTAEAALAHANGDKVEAAYRRGDLFGKRREMMEAWAQHCAATTRVSKRK